MKLNITKGLILIGAIALSSCSTQNKLASAKVDAGDDVYSSKAVAGDQPVYAERVNNYQHDNYTSSNYSDDYYNYDSYTARLNRFYDSPFALSYYDNLYYGSLSPYYTGIGLGLGLGYGAGYFGYSPFGYGYGYSPFYSYTPYSPFGYGSIYGYGAYPYGGLYSYYNTTNVGTYYGARPYRGPGVVSNTYGGNGIYTPPSTSRPQRTATVNPYPNNGNTVQQTRPQPVYQAQPAQSYPSSSSSGSSGGGASSGGGGSRPVRP